MSMAVLRTMENDLKSAECQSADIVDLREGADRFVFRGTGYSCNFPAEPEPEYPYAPFTIHLSAYLTCHGVLNMSQPSRNDLPLALWAPRIALLGMSIGILAILAVLLPGPLYRLGIVGLGGAFGMITYGAYGGMLAVLITVIGLILLLAARRREYFIRIIVGITLGVIAWGVPYMWLKKAESVPAIHDITTDTANPPQFQADILALRKGAANSTVYGGPKIAALQEKAYPDIQPMLFSLPLSQVYAAALQTVETRGWKLVSNDPATGIIEATATTFWFGFKDDVVIRIVPNGTGTRLDIRSESRIGTSDVGRNAQRIRAFRAALYKRLGLQYHRQ